MASKKWTESDEKLLKELFQKDRSNGFIADKLNRSEKSIERKLYKLKMKRAEGYVPKIPAMRSFNKGDIHKNHLIILDVEQEDEDDKPSYTVFDTRYEVVLYNLDNQRVNHGNIPMTYDEMYYPDGEQIAYIFSVMDKEYFQ